MIRFSDEKACSVFLFFDILLWIFGIRGDRILLILGGPDRYDDHPMSVRGEVPPALKPERLARLGFFREFSPPELRRLTGSGGLRMYADGELLATEGTRKQRRTLYVVLEGELQYVKRIRTERARIVLTLRPGDVGGFLTFFNDDPSPVTVHSVGRSRVFEIGRRELQLLMAKQPALAGKILMALLRAMVPRLDTFLGQIAATSAWALELEQHLRALPLAQEGEGGDPVDRGRRDAHPRRWAC